jgi:hypothetical protein
MAKKKLTPEDIQNEFTSLINSCVEGYTGEWDPSGEGRDGFEAMAQGLRKLASHYKVDVSDAKEV